MFLRSAYNYDREAASDETGVDCSRVVDVETGEFVETPSMTKQSFAEECDINTIVKRFGLTGQLPQNVRMPTFGDFAYVPDFHSAMNAIREANESFMEMPADVRARFGNDAGAFVAFCSDDRNRDEAVRLGLVPAKAPVAPPVAVADPVGSGTAVAPPVEAPIKP